MRLHAFAVSALLIAISAAPFHALDTPKDACAIVSAGAHATTAQFKQLMQTIADGWTEPDPRKAADCYAEDAIYSSPPDPHVHQGREDLYYFFYGDGDKPRKMGMVWHHLAFDEQSQVGFGEYTFRGTHQFHGIVVVQLVDGKIKNWREYEVISKLDWRQFIGKNQF